MSEGKMLAAKHDGCYVIKFAGDVRVTLCKTIDDYYDEMFVDEDFTDVAIDLSEAEGIDSTSLGLLAKLAIRARKKLNYNPTVYSPNPGITRLLESMGFQTLFSIRADMPGEDDEMGELPVSQINEAACRERVIEAHKILMGINEKNRAEFLPLLKALETS